MKILWDFRLFSYQYKSRGVGTFAMRMADALLSDRAFQMNNLLIWGNRACLPERFANLPVRYIPYTKGSWLSDLFVIPLLVVRYRIAIVHYWVALGPIFKIGMGLPLGFKTIGTIHDLGVEYWTGIPFLAARKKTRFWCVQKSIARYLSALVCNSESTRSECVSLFGKNATAVTIPLPIGALSQPPAPIARQPFFITLAGGHHKNVVAIVNGFALFRKKFPAYTLYVLGDGDHESAAVAADLDGVLFEPMTRYRDYLDLSTALIFCSLHEGLGIPPIEAMEHGCPLVLSDIAVLHEVCGNAARYADPHSPSAIAQALESVARDNRLWQECSCRGRLAYQKRSQGCAARWIELYKKIIE